MTEREELMRELSGWISEVLQCGVDPDRGEAKFVDDYGADSMDIVDIVERVERTYGVSISNDRVATVRTLGELVDLILE